MIFEHANASFVYVDGPGDELDWLERYVSYTHKGMFFATGSSRQSLYHRASRSLPAGILPTVVDACLADGIPFEIHGDATPPARPDVSEDLAWLRDHQLEALEKMVGHRRGLIAHGTGGGKGDLIVAMAKVIPCRWLFLVSSIDLVMDIAARWLRLAPHLGPPGIVGDGKFDVPEGARLVCCTTQTLAKGLKQKLPRVVQLLDSAEGVLIDEVQGAGADGCVQVVLACRKAYWRFGFSATPLERTDGRNLRIVGGIGPVVDHVPMKELVAKGVVTEGRVTMRVYKHEDVQAATWPGVETEAIVKSAGRNKLLVAMVKECEKPAFVFVKRLKHGRDLKKKIEKAGMRALFVWGNTVDRMRHVRDLLAGRLDVIVCNEVFQQGIDADDLRSIVIGTGDKSTIATSQRAGRGTRLAKGKTKFTIWEVYDVGHKFLDDHSKSRKKAYEAVGYEVDVEESKT